MKIVVLSKQVPDSTEITVDKKTGTLVRDGVPSIINQMIWLVWKLHWN